MNIHILNGDALLQPFADAGINGQVIVCRECLIDGPLDGNTREEFWNVRAAYISRTYSATKESYFSKVVTEFQKIKNLDNCDFYLWFEHDLFCQVNMWFTISLIQQAGIIKVYRINPAINSEKEKWNGYAMPDVDELRRCYESSIAMTVDDLKLGNDLWNAYRKSNLTELKRFSQVKSDAFPFLDEVCNAELERKQNQRPQKTLSKIMAGGETDFHQIYKQFWQQESIYGFGDAQVKTMISKLES